MQAYPPVFCNVCGTPLTVHRAVQGYCNAPACLAAMGARFHEERGAAEKAAIQTIAASHRESILQQHPGLQSQQLEVLVVPGFDADPQQMQHERRQSLRQHVGSLLASDRAAATTALVQPLDDAAGTLQSACTVCRGYCCRNGGNNAYLAVETISRVRQQFPSMDDAGIAAAYGNAVPATSMANSCIFHGDQGCTLPREFRADICNTYYCDPVKNLPQGGIPALSIVMIADLAVKRSTLAFPGLTASNDPAA